MKKTLTAALVVCLPMLLTAQSLERQVISATGSYEEISFGSVSATAGEVVVETAIASAVVLTQGFQQPLASDTVGGIFGVTESDLVLYPNPTSGELYILSGTWFDELDVYDGRGRLVLSHRDNRSLIDLASLQRGVYTITLRSKNLVYHSRIVKD